MSSNAQAATNPAVYAVGKMHISGNVIPNTWYQTIQTPGGKPYLNAIILLADIVYWYRPTEIRDERSGKTTGMQQKFRDDLLQRSYAALSDQFGLSRKQIKDALVFLENLGVITRVFRNKIVGGQCLSNVMYLDLHAAKLYELTYPTSVAEETCRKDSEVCTAGDTGADFCDAAVYPQTETAPSEEGRTNTENTTETSPEISDPSIHPDQEIDAMEMHQAYEEIVKENIGYEYLMKDRDLLHDHERIDELTNLIVDTVSLPRKTVRIGGADHPWKLVQSKFLKLTGDHIRYVLRTLSKNDTRIQNIRAYLLTTLYNATDTIDNYSQAEANSDCAGRD